MRDDTRDREARNGGAEPDGRGGPGRAARPPVGNAEEPAVDLSALDPTTDPRRFEALVAAISEAADDELARRRYRSGTLVAIGRRWRPLLAAAAVLAVVSAGALVGAAGREGEARTISEGGVEEALGLPASVAGWVRGDETPTPAELALTLEGER